MYEISKTELTGTSIENFTIDVCDCTSSTSFYMYIGTDNRSVLVRYDSCHSFYLSNTFYCMMMGRFVLGIAGPCNSVGRAKIKDAPNTILLGREIGSCFFLIKQLIKVKKTTDINFLYLILTANICVKCIINNTRIYFYRRPVKSRIQCISAISS